MSESGDTTKLMKEIWPDTGSNEEKEDSPIKINIKDDNSDLEANKSDSESEEYILKPKKPLRISISSDPKSSNSKSSDINEEIPSTIDAMNEYYKLKEKFESDMNIHKKKIINNPTLSNKEKRSEYLKLMPKCVNCKRPSRKGTIFSITYHPADDKTSEHKVFKAICGDLADPCNLHIEINIGIYQPLDQELDVIMNEIKETKSNIINDKNKLLFGLITTESAIENFDNNKTYISELTSIYEKYLDMWNKEVDNPEKKLELDEALVQSYESINNIKDCIKKMNENNDTQFAVDAANIYHTTLQPLLNKIRQLKYRVNVVFNDDNNYCRLIQSKYTTDDILISGYNHKVVSYDVGLKAMKPKKKQQGTFVIESDSSEKQSQPKEISIKINKQAGEIDDEPIIGQGVDGIDWHTKEYKELWSRLPTGLKTEFKSNIDWMKQFMHKCVNERINHRPGWDGCKITTPPNLVIPPRKMANGQYDFGVSIYNKVFNRLSESEQDTYLTLYKEDPQTKEKNYNILIETMNSLVGKEVNFGRVFF
jgi:hypothetical protein